MSPLSAPHLSSAHRSPRQIMPRFLESRLAAMQRRATTFNSTRKPFIVVLQTQLSPGRPQNFSAVGWARQVAIGVSQSPKPAFADPGSVQPRLSVSKVPLSLTKSLDLHCVFPESERIPASGRLLGASGHSLPLGKLCVYIPVPPTCQGVIEDYFHSPTGFRKSIFYNTLGVFCRSVTLVYSPNFRLINHIAEPLALSRLPEPN
jgi:hypothetical protein